MVFIPRFGAGCLSSSPSVFLNRMDMVREGVSVHTQLMIIPEERRVFENHLELYETCAGTIRIHAPHHTQHVNPCEPALYASGLTIPVTDHIEMAMEQTLEAADRTKSPFIVLHAGRYTKGTAPEAIARFHAFLDRYPDPRYILETLPILGCGHPLLGITPGELLTLANGKIRRFCHDLPHIFCTSQALGIPYEEFLSSFDAVPASFFHLSGTPGTGTAIQHLSLGDPGNMLPHAPAKAWFTRHPEIEVSVEIASDDPAVVRAELGYAKSRFS